MSPPPDNRPHAKAPLDLKHIEDAIVMKGLEGDTIERQLADFCGRIADAGFPMKRANLGMAALHPRYGAHTYIWRPGMAVAELTAQERGARLQQTFLQSPIHHMRSKGVTELMVHGMRWPCRETSFKPSTQIARLPNIS